MGKEPSKPMSWVYKIFAFFYKKDKSMTCDNDQLVNEYLQDRFGIVGAHTAHIVDNLVALKSIGDTLSLPSVLINGTTHN